MRRMAWIVGLALALTACGGSSGTGAPAAPPATIAPAATEAAVTKAAVTEAPAASTPEPTAEAASMAPGSIAYAS